MMSTHIVAGDAQPLDSSGVAVPPQQTLTTRTDSVEFETQNVGVWIQAPMQWDVMETSFFDNMTRRIADRGSCVAFTYYDGELVFRMATEAQASRAFQRINDVWMLDSQVFVRCRGSEQTYQNI